jgi:CHAT domain-containing protein
MARLATELGADDFELVVDEEDTRPPRRPAGRAAPATRAPDPVYLLVSVVENGRSTLVCRASLLTAGSKAAVLSGSVTVEKSALGEQIARIEQSALAPRELTRSGERLARTLLAASVREGLAGMSSHALVVVHDREASRVPWEAVRIDSSWPALAQGVSRRYTSEHLTVARWRETRIAGERLRVMLVVNPTEDLPGAAAEGAALTPLLEQHDADVESLTGAAATRDRVRGLLRSGRFDVLHFAGHGYFDPDRPGESGLICAGDEVLRGIDLEGIGDLPALVFFNACEAARVRRRTAAGRTAARGTAVRGADARRREARRSTRRPSTSLAEAFLVGGVANFLGTHWPVSDDAALTFSTTLYPALLSGRPLGTAIRDARRAVQARGSVDWADYVHYGNASFALTPPASK